MLAKFRQVEASLRHVKATDGLFGILMKAKIFVNKTFKGLHKVFNHFLLRDILVMTVGAK